MGLVTLPSEICYFDNHIECTGCHRLFCHTVKQQQDGEETLCMECFNHRNGLQETLEVIKEMENGWYGNNVYLWETPVDQIPKEIYDTIPFVRKNK